MNPFRKGTTSYNDYEVLKDLKWHCTKCELEAGQAKTWQIWQQEKGLILEEDEKGNKYKRIWCNNCSKGTVHRKLKTLEVSQQIITRSKVQTKLAKRVKEHYNFVDAYSLRVEPSNKLEIDHRIPQVRWKNSEQDNSVNLPEEEIEKRFMILTRENNLLKSRKCEKCYKTGIRQTGYNIEFYYYGTKIYEETIGCNGCFWYNPEMWRQKLNEFISMK